MKKSKKNLPIKEKTTSPSSVAELRQALFMLRLEQRAGQLLKTHQIKKLKKKIARQLTRQNQPKTVNKNEAGGEA